VTTSICAVGVAAPSWRLPTKDVNTAWGRGGGRGQSAVCAPDEDALTLAWAAADRAMAADGNGSPIDGLWWGTSRPPFAEGPSWTHLAATLRLGDDLDGSLVSGSTHAGVEALRAAADAVSAGRVTTALVICSDAIVPATGGSLEAVAGAAAVAVILRATGPAPITSAVTRWLPVLDRYRGDREDETRDAYDGRLFREEIYLPLLGGATAGREADRWSLPDPDGRLAAALAKRIGAETVSAPARAELGDTGAAAALVGAAGALGEVGTLAVVGYGGGRATVVEVQVDDPVPGADRVGADLAGGQVTTYTRALRSRRLLRPTGESVEMAVPPGSAMFVRGNHETLGLYGGRCVDCGTINIPPSIHPVCIGCGSAKFEEHALARTGSVQTFVINHTMPQPFEAPLPLVVVDLDDGARIQLQGATDGSDIAIGGRVELVLRRYTIERGVPIYGWKVVPVPEESS